MKTGRNFPQHDRYLLFAPCLSDHKARHLIFVFPPTAAPTKSRHFPPPPISEAARLLLQRLLLCIKSGKTSVCRCCCFLVQPPSPLHVVLRFARYTVGVAPGVIYKENYKLPQRSSSSSPSRHQRTRWLLLLLREESEQRGGRCVVKQQQKRIPVRTLYFRVIHVGG